MIHLIFVTKYRKKDRNNLKLHRKIAPKWGRSFLIKSVKLDPFAECDAILKILIYLVNPHLPCGRWRHSWPRSSPHRQFQSTPSLRKVTRAHNMDLGMWGKFQSTPSLRKVTIKISSTIWEYGISIHTFLAEGDNFNVFSSSNDSYFNPHLPCGRWHASGTIGITLPDFNPHLPCGRWLLLSAMAISASDFNPHLPCGRWRRPIQNMQTT